MKRLRRVDQLINRAFDLWAEALGDEAAWAFVEEVVARAVAEGLLPPPAAPVSELPDEELWELWQNLQNVPAAQYAEACRLMEATWLDTMGVDPAPNPKPQTKP